MLSMMRARYQMRLASAADGLLILGGVVLYLVIILAGPLLAKGAWL